MCAERQIESASRLEEEPRLIDRKRPCDAAFSLRSPWCSTMWTVLGAREAGAGPLRRGAREVTHMPARGHGVREGGRGSGRPWKPPLTSWKLQKRRRFPEVLDGNGHFVASISQKMYLLM